jgi:hypothetical protein
MTEQTIDPLRGPADIPSRHLPGLAIGQFGLIKIRLGKMLLYVHYLQYPIP